MRNLMRALARRVPRSQKQWLKLKVGCARRRLVDRFWSYGPRELRALLMDMGLRPGDTVLMHSAYRSTSGFLGSPQDLIHAVSNVVGDSGTLTMMSIQYTGSTADYLASGAVFDVRKTPSQMGIITEIFRRSGAERSLSPTHSILASGARAKWLVEGHENCAYPCGPSSPFERLLSSQAKMLFFDLPFTGFTFVHYIEHLLQDRLPFPLYEKEPMTATFIDHQGLERQAEVFVFTENATARRQVDVITDEMRRRFPKQWRRLGNTLLVLANMSDTVETALSLAERGKIPFSSL